MVTMDTVLIPLYIILKLKDLCFSPERGGGGLIIDIRGRGGAKERVSSF